MSDLLPRYRAFLAVADKKSISAAAKLLEVTQPAVSMEISTLESELGVKLFMRTNRGVYLTEEGEVLYEYAKKGMSFLEAGEDKMREMSGLQFGRLRIGASDMTLMFFLLEHIVSFREQYEGVNISVTNAPTPSTIEALRSGAIDFGVVSEPFIGCDCTDIDFVPVKEINDIFIAHPTCPLSRESKITKKQLSQYRINMLENNTSTRKYVSSWLGANFPEPSIELATSELLVRFTEQGLGISSVVEDFAREAIREGRVVKLDMAEKIPPRKFYIAYLRKMPMSYAARVMLDIIFETVDRRVVRGGMRHG
ncbi:MAG: LysR family transcriptional regulator [Clostridia bacterium]|nr:LysR family transcriptional regulator [Clostridia bacterium]